MKGSKQVSKQTSKQARKGGKEEGKRGEGRGDGTSQILVLGARTHERTHAQPEFEGQVRLSYIHNI